MIGTCRLLFRGQVARLGRLAVERDRRGDGVAADDPARGRPVAGEAGADVDRAARPDLRAARSTRARATSEYGPTFVEEGIEHVAMEKRLA